MSPTSLRYGRVPRVLEAALLLCVAYSPELNHDRDNALLFTACLSTLHLRPLAHQGQLRVES